ncbi:hypothetical protein V5799_030527 [Amblyomma americanum]|uniref:Uncharacterized protein n=1 Tax=Amblyomma americanum TaxID=6943 RepID=A0AAQ4EMX0_AMBAM
MTVIVLVCKNFRNRRRDARVAKEPLQASPQIGQRSAVEKEVVPVAEEANFDVLRDLQGNEALFVDTAPAPAIASFHRPSETSMVPEQAVALDTPAHVDAATNIVSCHLPVETSLVMNEAMAWDTPAHGALLMPLPYPTATATLTMSCQQTAASNLPAVPATAVSSLANVATATPMASCGISAASDLLVNPAMVVGTPADAQQLGRAAPKKPAARVSKTLGVPVVGSGFGTPGEDGQVQLGNGVHVSADGWTALMMETTDAAFCKRLAVALYGVEVLAKRSVFGKQSNKDIAKGKTMVHPPLSPMKLVGMSCE